MAASRIRIKAVLLTLLLGLDLWLANQLSIRPVISLPLTALALLPVLLLTLNAIYRQIPPAATGGALLLGLGLGAAVMPWLSHHIAALYLVQHLGINLALGLWFGLSLRTGHEPLVSRIARPLHPQFSPELQRYTRRVTLAWTLFFALMATLSLLLYTTAPRAVWSMFANAATLPLVALMFLGEFLVRRWALPPEDRLGPLSAWRAFRQAIKADA